MSGVSLVLIIAVSTVCMTAGAQTIGAGPTPAPASAPEVKSDPQLTPMGAPSPLPTPAVSSAVAATPIAVDPAPTEATPAPALEPTNELPAFVSSEPVSTRIAIGLMIAPPTQADFNSVVISNGSATANGKIQFNLDSLYGVALEVRRMPKTGWGLRGGIEIEAPRSITSLKLTSNGVTETGVFSNTPKYQAEVIYADAVYSWNSYYLPFGLNYSLPTFTSSGDDRFAISGDAGFQVGLGVKTASALSFEGICQVTSIRLVEAFEDSGTTYTVNYGTGTMVEARFFLKYEF